MIKINGKDYPAFNFPCGERHVNVGGFETANFSWLGDEPEKCVVLFNYENDAEIFELLLVCDALKRVGKRLFLYMPYVPYSRQDRVNVSGEPLSIKVFADVINSVGFEQVMVLDPHSDVVGALINNCFIQSQAALIILRCGEILANMDNKVIVVPDAGAQKKIQELVKLLNDDTPVVECSKVRNAKTGEITGVNVHCGDLSGKTCVIVDDICDGGRTFIEIAKKLKERDCQKIILIVTHGFFTGGLEVFDGLIDEIYSQKGRVK